jgi:hypothetical protein
VLINWTDGHFGGACERHLSPKRRMIFNMLHGVIYPKIELFTILLSFRIKGIPWNRAMRIFRLRVEMTSRYGKSVQTH